MNHQKPSLYLLIVLHLIVLIVAIVLLNRRFAFFKPVNSVTVSTEVPETSEIHSTQNSAETEIETVTDVEAKTDAITDADAKTDVVTDAVAKTDVITDADAKTDVVTDADAKTDVVTDAVAKTEVTADTDTATTPFISKCRINLHIRTTPALSGKIIGRIPPRGTGMITERTNEEWVKVEYKNIVGYSFSRYLEFDPFFGTENSPTKETEVSETEVSKAEASKAEASESVASESVASESVVSESVVSESVVSESESENKASETPSSAMPDAGQEITKDIIIIRSACYIRNSAGDKNKRNIILTAQNGDEFLHLAAYDQPAWYAIAVEGQSIAYVSRKYAEIETRKTEE